jgi:predicted esterase
MAPLESNQPFLDSALRQVETMVSDLIRLGIASQRIALLGFSQGACLTSEFVARHPRRYGAVIAFTGGLLGPPGTPRIYPGSLAGTPVLLGSNDPDAHIPFERVKETAEVLTSMGAQLELRRYPDMPHIINDDEVEVARKLLQQVIAAGKKAK